MEIIPRRKAPDVPRTDVFQFFEDMHQVIRDSKTEITAVQSSNDELRILLKNERNIRKTVEASIAAAQVKISETEGELVGYKERVTFLESELEASNESRDALTEYITAFLTLGGLDHDNDIESDKLEPSASQQEGEGCEKQEILSAVYTSEKSKVEPKVTQSQGQKATSHRQGSFEEESNSGASYQDDEVFYSHERSRKVFFATDAAKEQVMKALKIKLRAEQERSFELEDRILELQQSLDKERNRSEKMEKDFSNEKEHLNELLRRQRLLSERISCEGDCAVTELQGKLRQMKQDNIHLKQTKRSWSKTYSLETSDKECQIEGGRQAQGLQFRTQNMFEGVSEYRVGMSSQQAQTNKPIKKRHSSHSNASVRILISDEQTQTNSFAETHQRSHSNAPTVVELSNQHSQTNDLTDDIHGINRRSTSGGKARYSNVAYRTHLSQMIRDGLQWFCTMGNRGTTTGDAQDI